MISRFARTILAAAFLLIAFVICIPSAQAQFKSATLSITNTVPATTTNTSPNSGVIDLSRVTEGAVQIALKLGGAGTTAIPFVFQRSVDGSNYTTGFTISVTPAGTSTVTTLTNIVTGAVPYWKITSIQNDNASAITNLVVTYGFKRSSN